MQHLEVVAGVIVVNGRLVLAKRKKEDHLGGFWEFPGGKIEDGETPEMALVREIEEELGIRVTPVKEIAVVEHQYPEKLVRLHFVLAEAEDVPKALDCEDVALVDVKEVSGYRLAPADERAWRLIREDTLSFLNSKRA